MAALGGGAPGCIAQDSASIVEGVERVGAGERRAEQLAALGGSAAGVVARGRLRIGNGVVPVRAREGAAQDHLSRGVQKVGAKD